MAEATNSVVDFSHAANCCYENPYYACLLASDLLQAGARLDHHERGAPSAGALFVERVHQAINSALECDALDVAPLLIEAGSSLAAPQRTVAFHPRLSRAILPALAYVRSKAALELILKHAGPDETSRQALLQRVPTRNPPPKAVSMAAAEAMGIARSELNTKDIAWSPNQLVKLESFVLGPPLG